MTYLLDTDHITILQYTSGEESTRLATRIDTFPENEFAFSLVSFHEQVLGAHRYIAQAQRAADLIVLTRNAKDFSKVPGLTFEDWTLP